MSDANVSKLERVFGLDPRSLAVFRVGIGLLAVIDALEYFRVWPALLTNLGAVPEMVAPGRNIRWSVPFLVGGQELAPLWLGLLALAGVAMMLGWRTRAATFVVWFIECSLQARNPYDLYGYDILMRTLLFWSLFLPLGSVASLDRNAGREAPPPPRVLSAASVAWVVQLMIIYVVTGVIKNGMAWYRGNAGWYAVSIDWFTGPLGVWIRELPIVLQLGTWATLLLEIPVPFLLLVPWKNDRIRMAVIAGMVAFHLGLEVLLEIGWFPWVSICGWIPMLPGSFWDRLGWWTHTVRAGVRDALTWLVDGVVIAALVLVLAWNVVVVKNAFPGTKWGFPSGARRVSLMLRLDQQWDMYAPSPLRDDGWWVVDAVRPDGTHIDLITGEETRWGKPADVPHHYGGVRWNKFMRGLVGDRAEPRRTAYLDWLCDHHNGSVPESERVSAVSMVFVLQHSPPPGQPEPKPVKGAATEHTCPVERLPPAERVPRVRKRR